MTAEAYDPTNSGTGGSGYDPTNSRAPSQQASVVVDQPKDAAPQQSGDGGQQSSSFLGMDDSNGISSMYDTAEAQGRSDSLSRAISTNTDYDSRYGHIAGAGGKPANMDQLKEAVNYLTNKELPDGSGRRLTREQAIALVANGYGESDFNTRGTGDANSGGSYGIFQWHGSRIADAERFFHKPIFEASAHEQMDFALHEMFAPEGKERGAGAALLASHTVNGATAALVHTYERPANPEHDIAIRTGHANWIDQETRQPPYNDLKVATAVATPGKFTPASTPVADVAAAVTTNPPPVKVPSLAAAHG